MRSLKLVRASPLFVLAVILLSALLLVLALALNPPVSLAAPACPEYIDSELEFDAGGTIADDTELFDADCTCVGTCTASIAVTQNSQDIDVDLGTIAAGSIPANLNGAITLPDEVDLTGRLGHFRGYLAVTDDDDSVTISVPWDFGALRYHVPLVGSATITPAGTTSILVSLGAAAIVGLYLSIMVAFMIYRRLRR